MATRAGSSPVQVVARAARHRTLRSMLVAVGAIIATTLVVTAALVWPVGQHDRAACAPDKTSVSVYPFLLSVDMTGAWSPSATSAIRGGHRAAVPPADPRAGSGSDTGSGTTSADGYQHSDGRTQRPRVSGCVATTDLTPANPHTNDGRG